MVEAGKSVYNNLSEKTNSNCSQNVKVSGEGAWQKEVTRSLNVVVTLVLSKKCM